MKKFTELLNEINLNEGAVGDIISNILKKGGKTIPKVAIDSAEISVKKIVDDLVKSTVTKGGIKQISRKSIVSHPDYFKTVGQLANETSMVRHGMDLEGVSKKLGKQQADQIAKESSQAVEEALMVGTKEKGLIVKSDTAAAQRGVTNAKNLKATQAEMDAALSVLKPNQKMGREISRMEKILQNPNSVTSKKLISELNKSTKQTVVTGTQVSTTLVGNTATVSTKKGLYTVTKEQLKKIPVPIRKIIIGKTILATLTKLGLTVAALYLIYKWLFPDEAVVLTDEGGKDLGDTNLVTGGWAECIKQLINNKEATIESFGKDDSRVIVQNSDYPEGLAFYTNGRVIDLKTKKMGNWECVGGKPTTISESNKLSLMDMITEQSDDEIDSDVDRMIDLLDFPVSQQNMVDASELLKKYENSPKGADFLNLYKSSGWGKGDLMKSINNVFTTEPKSVRLKGIIQKQIKNIQSGSSETKSDGETTTSGKVGLKNIKITWDSDKKSEEDGGTVVKKKSKYTNCNDKDLPHSFGCKSQKIKEVQKCLGMELKYQTGNFGPITKSKLDEKGHDSSKGLTQELYDKIIASCADEEGTKKMQSVDMVGKSDKKSVSDYSTDNLSQKLKSQPKIQMNQQTPIEYFNLLKKGGYIQGGEGSGRIKYKGPIPDQSVVEKLDTALDSMGYYRLKQVPKEDGEEIKYVWEKK